MPLHKSCVQRKMAVSEGVGFGLTPSDTHTRNVEDCTPSPTSTTTNQRVKELVAEVVELREKCYCVESLKAEVMMMRKMFSQLKPMFRYPKIKNVTQTLLNEISHQTSFFFFFGIPYQTCSNCLDRSLGVFGFVKISILTLNFFI